MKFRVNCKVYDMSNFKIYNLKDIADSQTGPFGSQLHQSDYVKIGTPMVTVEHLGVERFTHQNLPFVSNKDRDRLSKYILKEGDIVFSRVGSVDRCTYVSKEEDGWMFSGRCIRVRTNENAIGRYLNFYFRQEAFKKMMLNISVGATMPSLNTKLMDDIPIRLPRLQEQSKIASFLTNLDTKIDINNKINAELEAMAKLIYDYWFVQFDFPIDKAIAEKMGNPSLEGKPYKASGGKMVYNKELKREIPDGWEEKELSEIAAIKAGGDKPKVLSSRKTEICNIPIYSNGISNEGLYGFTDKAKIYKQSITVTGRGANVGHSVLRNTPFLPIIRLLVVTPIESFHTTFLHERIKELNFQNSGSAQPQITVPQVSSLPVLMPTPEILKKYDDLTSSGVKTIENNKEQNRKLSELRDWLLPMLMNGQVRVKDENEKQ